MNLHVIPHRHGNKKCKARSWQPVAGVFAHSVAYASRWFWPPRVIVQQERYLSRCDRWKELQGWWVMSWGC